MDKEHPMKTPTKPRNISDVCATANQHTVYCRYCHGVGFSRKFSFKNMCCNKGQILGAEAVGLLTIFKGLSALFPTPVDKYECGHEPKHPTSNSIFEFQLHIIFQKWPCKKIASFYISIKHTARVEDAVCYAHKH